MSNVMSHICWLLSKYMILIVDDNMLALGDPNFKQEWLGKWWVVDNNHNQQQMIGLFGPI